MAAADGMTQTVVAADPGGAPRSRAGAAAAKTGTDVRKVLLLADHYDGPWAGTERQLWNLIEGLNARGVATHLALLRSSRWLESGSLPCPHTVWRIPKLASPRAVVHLSRLAAWARAAGFQVAHVFFNDASIAAPPFLRAAGLRVVVSRRDMGFWYTRGNLAVLRVVRRWVDAVVANSEAVKRITCEREHFPPERVRVIYNGYPVPDAAPLPAPPGEMAGIPPGAPVLGLVANIRPIKRIEDAVRATAALATRGIPAHLVIVGRGDPSDLIRLAEELGIGDRVHLTGPQHAVARYVAHFTIGLMCSESEGFSNAIVEYLQHGKPVVCTDTGGNPEVIVPGENGDFYPVGRHDVLADRLASLLVDPGRLARMAAGTAASLGERFGLDRMTDAHLDLYIELLRRRGATRPDRTLERAHAPQ
jgi:glycosyltransferase involved in cell wall biosynthesis